MNILLCVCRFCVFWFMYDLFSRFVLNVVMRLLFMM